MHMHFTEARRRELGKKVDRLDRLESRTTITEPMSFVGLSVPAPGACAARVHVPIRRYQCAPAHLCGPRTAAKQAGPKPYFMPANLLTSIDAIALGHHSRRGRGRDGLGLGFERSSCQRRFLERLAILEHQAHE